MARTFRTSTGQSFPIPEEGEVFTSPGTGQVYKLQGGRLYGADIQSLSSFGFNQQGIPSYDFGNLNFLAGLGAFGIPMTEQQFFPGTMASNLSTAKFFAPQPIQQTGETLSVTPHPQNPNAPVLTSSVRGVLTGAPPIPQGVPSGKVGVGGAPILTAPQVISDTGMNRGNLAPLGSADRTNQLLQIASKQTGIKARTFTGQVNQKVPIIPQIPSQMQQNAPQAMQTLQTSPSTSLGIDNVPQAPEPSIADEVKGILSSLGISLPTMTQSPVTSAADIYKQFAEMTNITGMKKDLEDLVAKKTQEISDINENPFMSEGLRQKKITNIENKYQIRIDTLQSSFNRADEDARFLTGKYLEQVHQTQQDTQDILFKAVDLAEKEILSKRVERKESERMREFELRHLQQEQQFQQRETLAEQRFRQTMAGEGVILDPATVDLMAQTYLTTGNIPSLGFGTAGAAQRAQIFKRAAQIAGQQGLTGQDVALNKAAFTANQQALGQLSKQKNLAESFEKTAGKNLDLALRLSSRTTRAGVPILTRWVQSVQTGVFGDPQVQQLQNAVQTAVTEYAKVVTGQTTGAAVSDSARGETSKLLQAAFSPRQFKAAVEVLKLEMRNRIQGFDEQTRQLQREIKGGPTTPGASEKVQQEQSMSDEDAYQLYLQSIGQ